MKPKEYRLNWHQRIYISILCVYRVMRYGSTAVLFKKEEDELVNRVIENERTIWNRRNKI